LSIAAFDPKQQLEPLFGWRFFRHWDSTDLLHQVETVVLVPSFDELTDWI